MLLLVIIITIIIFKMVHNQMKQVSSKIQANNCYRQCLRVFHNCMYDFASFPKVCIAKGDICNIEDNSLLSLESNKGRSVE